MQRLRRMICALLIRPMHAAVPAFLPDIRRMQLSPEQKKARGFIGLRLFFSDTIINP